jgi:hypothetical protein
MNETKLEFTKVREAKRCVVFDEQPEAGKPPVIGTLYIQKWFVGGAEQIKVTVTLP